MNTLNTITKSQLTEIRDAMKIIVNHNLVTRFLGYFTGKHRVDFVGLCHNLANLCPVYGFTDCMDIICNIAKHWPKHSGDCAYPVPCPDGGDPRDAFKAVSDLYSGAYGKLRLELAQFIIDKINETLEDKE